MRLKTLATNFIVCVSEYLILQKKRIYKVLIKNIFIID